MKSKRAKKKQGKEGPAIISQIIHTTSIDFAYYIVDTCKVHEFIDFSDIRSNL